MTVRALRYRMRTRAHRTHHAVTFACHCVPLRQASQVKWTERQPGTLPKNHTLPLHPLHKLNLRTLPFAERMAELNKLCPAYEDSSGP